MNVILESGSEIVDAILHHSLSQEQLLYYCRKFGNVEYIYSQVVFELSLKEFLKDVAASASLAKAKETIEKAYPGITGHKQKRLYLAHKETEVALPVIFNQLVSAGFIAGEDRGESLLQPFLDAFDPFGNVQGRIIWTKKGKNKMLSKAQLCDFILFHGIDSEDLAMYSMIIFGVSLSGRALSDGQARRPDRNKRLMSALTSITE